MDIPSFIEIPAIAVCHDRSDRSNSTSPCRWLCPSPSHRDGTPVRPASMSDLRRPRRSRQHDCRRNNYSTPKMPSNDDLDISNASRRSPARGSATHEAPRYPLRQVTSERVGPRYPCRRHSLAKTLKNGNAAAA
ncbi:expressed unknown protein [Seminavis robusta]|uniref:Uncharacterized protein n=1 Tax=Seminavis robusta TaxID=568900 RepID=A0A9N8HE08_9STRA|nr:expressed unknown protein [Seminavis robusta]|eukprot:Sro366_g127620.1 n/a (134) ;mRNA; f:44181-44582